MRSHSILGRGAVFAATLAVALLALLAPLSRPAEAQLSQCHVNVIIDNQVRRVRGTVEVECGGGECPFPPFCHTPPFGNWGVDTSLPSSRNNRDQFRGWKGSRSSIKGQWNSCTTYRILVPPGPRYNDGYGRQRADPDDARIGGWKSHRGPDNNMTCSRYMPEVYSVDDVEMVLYELDSPGRDDYITTLEYGDFDVQITCSGDWNCSGTSSWRSQNSVDSTGVSAQARIRVVTSREDAHR